MAGRLAFSDVGSSLSNLPGPAKWVGAALTLGPLLFGIVGMGYAGWQTPSKMERHISQMDSIRQESTARDSAMLRELREGNRLAICTLKYTSNNDRLRCAVPRRSSSTAQFATCLTLRRWAYPYSRVV